jgi:hypothetical protein
MYIYDFLDESILPDVGHARITDDRILAELESYRSHVAGSLSDIREGWRRRNKGPNAFVATGTKPTTDRVTLRHMALYFERAVIDDPLLSVQPPSGGRAVLAEFISGGAASAPALDRARLAAALDFLAAVRPLVKAGFLTIAPFGNTPDPSSPLPLLYSPTAFEERVPERLREWFRSRARVHGLWRAGDTLVSSDEPLKPTRTIGIQFDGLNQAMAFRLMRTTPESHSDDPRHVTFTVHDADAPVSEEEFNVWVAQSINQLAGNVYADVTRDVINAASLEAMLLTDSTFVEDFLSYDGDSVVREHAVAELALQIQLPVLDTISESDLMRVRGNEPASLAAFRIQLDRGLSSISSERDEAEKQRKLAEFRHEMTLRAREADLAVQRLQRAMKTDMVLGAVSLAASYFAGGLLAAGALVAARDALKRLNDYSSNALATPGHFLMKLQRAAKTSAP